MPFNLQYCSTVSDAGLNPGLSLGVIGFGALPSLSFAIDCPAVRVEIPVLSGAPYELWSVDETPYYESGPRIASARAGALTFGLITVPYADGEALAAAVEDAYKEIFAFVAGSPHPYLLRMWNYLPRINEDSEGLERYRWFNLGRHKAFLEHFRQARPPAASCLGTAGDTLVIYFLAGSEPGIAIENPRQVAAYDYPSEYGPKSPNFSRALLTKIGGEAALFISGTASIVGHRSLHPRDPVKQTEETIRNMNLLIEAARGYEFSSGFEAARVKVYIRRPEHLPLIRDCLERTMPRPREIVYVKADVCRAELLVEIEAAIF